MTPYFRRIASLLPAAVLLLAAVRLEALPPQLDQVVVVFKTHFDIGYTDLGSNVVQRYRTSMIDQALQVVDQNRDLPPDRQFVWTLSGWPLTKIAENWPGQTAARRGRVFEAFRQGRFVVHALPFTTHTELLEAEDLVRGLGFSSRLSREAGLALPRDAKMTDVPCHSWILPALLRHAGVDFLHLGCNAASSSPRVPALFWWEGPDASRLLTMYTAESYGTGLVPPDQWPYRTWLALIHTGDNHGPPTPDEVKKVLDDAAAQLPGIRVRIGRLSDFADAIRAESAPVPVVRGDMPDTWIHGPMCDPAGARLARNTRPAIAIAETLATHLRCWRIPGPDNRSATAQAYEQSLLYGEHTWGGAYWWIYGKYQQYYGDKWREERDAGRFKRIESSWAEHTAYIERAAQLTQPFLDDELRALARAVNMHGPRLVVFNPLPWKRDGLVEIPLSSLNGNTVLSAANGARQEMVDCGNGVGRFVARDVPATGYRTFRLSRGNASGSDSASPGTGQAPGGDLGAAPVLTSPFFKATLDPNCGTIRSLLDRHSGRELVDPDAPHGFGQYLYERFSKDEVEAYVKAYVKISADWATNELGKPSLPPASAVPYRAASPGPWTLRVERARATETAVLEAPATAELPAVTTRFTLYRDLPYADLALTVHDKAADPWPEAGWLCLPFKIADPQFRLGRLGAIIDPTKDIVPGANRHLFGIDTGVTLTDPLGNGAGFCALDNPLVSLDTPGCWKYSLDFVPRRPAVYVNLFNNQWTTNFRLWNSGTWTARVRLWAVRRGGRPETALVLPSLEARFPLQAMAADGPAGSLASRHTGLALSQRGVRVTAFGANPDGAGTILRLWEQAGAPGRCTVQLPPSLDPSSVQPVDLRGRPVGSPIRVQRGSFDVEVKAFAPVTVVIP